MIFISTHCDAHQTWLILSGNIVQVALSASFFGAGKPPEGCKTAETHVNAMESHNSSSPRSLKSSSWVCCIAHPRGCCCIGGDDPPWGSGSGRRPSSLSLTLLPGRSCDGLFSWVLSPVCATQACAGKGGPHPLSHFRQSENVRTRENQGKWWLQFFSMKNKDFSLTHV